MFGGKSIFFYGKYEIMGKGDFEKYILDTGIRREGNVLIKLTGRIHQASSIFLRMKILSRSGRCRII
jgi:hypothetical protein